MKSDVLQNELLIKFKRVDVRLSLINENEVVGTPVKFIYLT